MFTGIIEGLGSIIQIAKSDYGMRLTVESDFILDEVKIGDSMYVNGACLTVIKIEGKRFQADVSPETLEKTNFKKAKIGERVNLERALRFSDRINGHLVTGHIDGTAIVKSRRETGNAIIFSFEISRSLTGYIIKKGSIAIDGISLTINNCDENNFEVSIIHHTAGLTTIGFKKAGDKVNIETDIIGKYVERFVAGIAEKNTKEKSSSILDKEYLAKMGFI